jgi:hypothetical protein
MQYSQSSQYIHMLVPHKYGLLKCDATWSSTRLPVYRIL